MSGTTVGGVDSSIPLQAGKGVAPPNSLQTIGEFASIQNALNQAKMFPGALALQGGQQTLQGQEIQRGQVINQNTINQATAGALAPLLAPSSGPITHKTLTDALGSIEANLHIPTNGIIQHLTSSLPNGDGPAFDAAARNYIAAWAQPPAGAVSQVVPQAGPQLPGVNNASAQPTIVQPHGSQNPGIIAPAGAAIPVGMTPGEAGTPTTIGVTPQGAPIVGTRGQFIGAATGQSPLGTGRLPAALLNPANHSTMQPGIVTGLGPAAEAQQTAQGGQSAKAFQDIAEQGVQARGQNATLGNMLGDIANFAPGPEKVNEFKKTLQRYAPSIASTFGITPESVAANESFDKLANQIAGAQGERSDARLSVAQQANPGSHLSPAGVDLVIRQLQGNADYLQARAKSAATYPDQTNRAGFEADVGAKLDPRAFQFARMTPAQQATYYDGLSDADKKAVHTAYNNAFKAGLLNAP